jgi:hypothetical protein
MNRQGPQQCQECSRHPPILNPKSKTKNRLRLSKCLSLFVRTHVDLYRDPRRHLRLRPNLNLDLNLDLNLNLALNLDLYLDLNLFLFQMSFRKPNQSSFRWL